MTLNFDLYGTARHIQYLTRLFDYYLQNILGKKRKQKQLNSLSALETDIKLPIHHELQQYLKMIEVMASNCIQFNDLASLRESQDENATQS